jgi:hypothetical protein
MGTPPPFAPRLDELAERSGFDHDPAADADGRDLAAVDQPPHRPLRDAELPPADGDRHQRLNAYLVVIVRTHDAK